MLGHVMQVIRAVMHDKGALKFRSKEIECARAKCQVLHLLPCRDLSRHGMSKPRKTLFEAVNHTSHAFVAEQ